MKKQPTCTHVAVYSVVLSQKEGGGGGGGGGELNVVHRERTRAVKVNTCRDTSRLNGVQKLRIQSGGRLNSEIECTCV